jgi:hypothetical protein
MAKAIKFILEQMGTSSRPQTLTILYQLIFFYLITKIVDIVRISAKLIGRKYQLLLTNYFYADKQV